MRNALEHYGVKGMRWGSHTKSSKMIKDGRVRKSTASILKNTNNSKRVSTSHQKPSSGKVDNIRYPENLKGRSLLYTRVSETPKWLEDNGYRLSVDAALDAVKSIIPERKSSGDDIRSAIALVNQSGKRPVRNLSASRIGLGEEVIRRMVKLK